MIDADSVIFDFLSMKAEMIEQQILEKGEMLDLFFDLNQVDPEGVVSDQIAMITTDLDRLIKELLELRKDSEYVSPKVQGVIDRMGRIVPVSHESLMHNFKVKYLWIDNV